MPAAIVIHTYISPSSSSILLSLSLSLYLSFLPPFLFCFLASAYLLLSVTMTILIGQPSQFGNFLFSFWLKCIFFKKKIPLFYLTPTILGIFPLLLIFFFLLKICKLSFFVFVFYFFIFYNFNVFLFFWKQGLRLRKRGPQKMKWK